MSSPLSQPILKEKMITIVTVQRLEVYRRVSLRPAGSARLEGRALFAKQSFKRLLRRCKTLLAKTLPRAELLLTINPLMLS